MSRAPQRIIGLAHLLKPVRNEVIGLLFNHYVFLALREIVRRNKRLQVRRAENSPIGAKSYTL
jgi:hypothetical protein